MRSLPLAILALVAGSYLGCTSGDPSQTSVAVPANAPASGAVALGQPILAGGIGTSALALFEVSIDPATLAATVTLRETRQSQANDDLYQLSIGNFLNASSLQVTSVQGTATTIDVAYRFTHPFPAPSDPNAAPNGFSNRADLSITGLVLFLTDVPTATGNTYFTDRVANTSLITNADAYFAPAGLLSLSTTANVFPYKLLVDETGPDGSRVGVSNGGDVFGNYGSDGWTRAEFGLGNAAWTGYGVLHGGQASDSMISLDRTALSSGPFSFTTAVIAKYNDPRGGVSAAEKRGNRLPPASPDPLSFAYRMPHGALDVASIAYAGESGGFLPNQISASTLSFHVVDWDARAAETSELDLAADLQVTNVAAGESGLPGFAVSIPGVLGDATVVENFDPGTDVLDDDSAFGGDVDLDTGAQGDALFYSRSVTHTVTSGQTPGVYTGLARATDPETGLVVPLDGLTLTPLTSNLPVPETYQAFQVVLGSANTLPTGNWTLNTATITDGGTTNISVNTVVDPDSPTFGIEVDWDNGGGFVSVATGLAPGAGPFGPYASPAYTLANPVVAEMRTLAVRLVDETSTNTTPATNVGGAVLTINPFVPGSCNAPAAGTDIAASWLQSHIATTVTLGFTAATGGTTGGAGSDIGAFRDPAYPGWVMQDKGSDRNFYRITETDPPTAIALTSGNLGGTLTGQNVYDIEIDSTNRMLWTSRTSTWHVSAVASVYGTGSGASVNIQYIDYAGSVVSGTPNTIGTGADRVVAMCLGPNDDVYWVDTTSILHRNIKASGYVEDLTGIFPLDLKPIIGLPTLTGANMRRIDDLVLNWHNEAFYILVRNDADGNATGAVQNAFLWRIDCDGTPHTGSPFAWQLSDSTRGSWETQGDIILDQFNTTGAAINEGDKQMVVLGENRNPGLADLWVFNSDLVMTASTDFATASENDSRVCGAISMNNQLMTRRGTFEGLAFYATPPAGWQ